VRDAERLYRVAVPVIKRGTSRLFGSIGASWRHPSGWQALRRISEDGKTALVVLHTFSQAPAAAEVPLPEGRWSVVGQLALGEAEVSAGAMRLEALRDFEGAAVLLRMETT